MHTLNRLQNYKILKLEDELSIQESKVIWRWEKGLIPKSLNSIIKEKVDHLRGRRFEVRRNNRKGSINERLTKLANSNITTISSATSKKVLSNNIKSDIFNRKYNFNCANNQCYICNQ